MLNIGPLKLLLIMAVALLVFGPDKLPEIARQVGRAVREFRKFQAAMHQNVRDVIEPITGPILPTGPVLPASTNVNASPPTAAAGGEGDVQPERPAPDGSGERQPDQLPDKPH